MSAAIMEFCGRSDVHLGLCNVTSYVFYNMTRDIILYSLTKGIHGAGTQPGWRGSTSNMSLKLYLHVKHLNPMRH